MRAIIMAAGVRQVVFFVVRFPARDVGVVVRKVTVV
jgi:hypothetical protein